MLIVEVEQLRSIEVPRLQVDKLTSCQVVSCYVAKLRSGKIAKLLIVEV